MKKIFSAILLMAAMAFSVSTFVSCNDLTQEMEDVTAQAGANADAIAALNALAAELQQDLNAAEQAIEAAKTEAAAAAAKAEANAIKKAQELVDALEQKVAEGYATKEDLQAAVDVINASLGKKLDITTFDAKVAEILATIGGINTQIDALETYNTTQDANIKKVADDLAAARAELLGKIEAEKTALMALINGNADAIKANKDAITGLNNELDALEGRVKANEDAIADLEEEVERIDAELLQLNADLKTYADWAAYKVLKSLAYIPHTVDGQLNAIEDSFYSIFRCEPGIGEDESCLNAGVGTAWVAGSCAEFRYRVNPIDAKIAKEDISFIGRIVKTRAEGDITDYMEIVEFTENDGDGEIVVKARIKEDLPGDLAEGIADGEAVLVALQVANNDYAIVSDYVALADTDLRTYQIHNPKNNMQHYNVHWHVADYTTKYNMDGYTYGELYPEKGDAEGTLYSVQDFLDMSPELFYPIYAYVSTGLEEPNTTPVELVYSGQVCLLDYVATYCNELEATLDEALPCVDVTYTFELPETYLSPVDKKTNQQNFVAWADKENGILEVKLNGNLSSAEDAKIVAVGKTPIVEVMAWANGKEIAKAYIKIDIVEEPTVPSVKLDHLVVPVSSKEFIYTELATAGNWDKIVPEKDAAGKAYTLKNSDEITWDYLTTKVLADRGIYMSNQQFANNYDVESSTDKVVIKAVIDGKEVDITKDYEAGVSTTASPKQATPTTTTWAGYYLNSYMHENCYGTITITIPSMNEYKYPTVDLVFDFSVKHETILPKLVDIYSADKIVTIKGHSASKDDVFGWAFQERLHEAFNKATYGDVCAPNHTALAFRLGKNAAKVAPWAYLIDEYKPAAREDAVTNATNWQNTIIALDVDGKNAAFEEDILFNYYDLEGYAFAGIYRGSLDSKKYPEAAKYDDLVWPANGYVDVPVELYTVLDNGNECVFEYVIRFENPFAVKLSSFSLETEAVGDIYDNAINKNVTVTFDGNTAYNTGAYSKTARDLGFDGELEFEFSILGSTVHADVAKGVNNDKFPNNTKYTDYAAVNWLHWYDNGMVFWNNGGTVLHNDLVNDATVYVFHDQIGWFTVKEPATVTLKATKEAK